MTATPLVQHDASGGLAVSPYQGLTPYTESRSAYFFGRDADIVRIVDHLNAYPLTVLIGPSGVGKSSVLQAGVLSKIRRDNGSVFEQIQVIDSVVAYWANWRDDPEVLLAQVVAGAFEEALGKPNDLSRTSLDAEAITAYANTHDVDLLLVLDQFEELFLYHDERVVDPFARSVAGLMGPGSRTHLLISIREDGLAKLKAFERAIPRIFDNTLRLEHLNRAAAAAAIVKPVEEVFNRDVPETDRREVEAALVDSLLDQVRTGRVRVDTTAVDGAHGDGPEAATARFEAPFLQLVLLRLWDEEARRHSRVLRASTLAELGGAQEIVRQHLDRVTAQLSDDDLAVMVRAFGHLVTPSGSKMSHTIRDLAGLTDTPEADMERVVRLLCQSERLVLREVPGPIDDPHEKPRFQIFHDVLAAAVLDWRRRKLDQVRATALENEVREANHRLRRTRMALAGLAVVMLLCLALAVSSLVFWGQASNARDDADVNADMAEAAKVLASDPSSALAKALPLWRDNDKPELETLVRQAYDAATAVMEIDLGSPAVHVDYLADDLLVAVTKDGWVRVIRLTDDDASTEVDVDVTPGESDARVTNSAVTGSGDYVVVATSKGDVFVVNTESGDREAVPDIEGAGRITINAVRGGRGNLVALLNEEYYYVVDATTAERVPASMGPPSGVWDLGVDHSGEFLAVAHNHKIEIWDATARTDDDNREIQQIAVPGGASATAYKVGFVGLDSDHVLFASATDDGDTVIYEWDRTSDAEPKRLQEERHLQTMDRGRQGDLVVVGDKHAYAYPAVGRAQRLEGAATRVAAAAVSAQDPRLVAIAAVDGEVALFELGKNTTYALPLVQFAAHPAPLSDVRFAPRGNQLLTAALDGTLRLWRLPERSVVFQAKYRQQLIAARYADNGQEIVTVTWDGKVRRIAGLQVSTRDPVDEVEVIDMDVSADGSILALAQEQNVPVIQRDFGESGPTEFQEPKLCDAVQCDVELTKLRWSPAGPDDLLVAGTANNMFVVWDGATGEIVGGPKALGGRAAEVTDLEFSGDGRHLVIASSTGVVTVVSTEDWKVETAWRTTAANAVAVNRDGTLVATAAARFVVEVWDAEDTDEPVCQLPEPRGSIDDLAFSQDEASSRLTGAGAEGITYVWDPGRCGTDRNPFLASLLQHSDIVSTVAFDPRDVNTLMSTGNDADVLVYECQICNLDRDALIEAAQERVMVSVDLAD